MGIPQLSQITKQAVDFLLNKAFNSDMSRLSRFLAALHARRDSVVAWVVALGGAYILWRF